MANPKQTKTGFDNSVASPTLTLDNTLSAGSWIVTSVLWNPNTVTLNSITDNLGHTYTIYDNPTGSGSLNGAQAAAKVTNTGSCTITYHFSTATGGIILYSAQEIEGRSTTDPVGSCHVARLSSLEGTGTDAISTGNITSIPANSYIYGWGYNVSLLTLAAGTGFDATSIATAISVENLLFVAGGSKAVTWTAPSNDFYLIGAMALAPAVTGFSLAANSGSYAMSGTAAILRPGSTTWLRYRK